jgi:hypothetical protein
MNKLRRNQRNMAHGHEAEVRNGGRKLLRKMTIPTKGAKKMDTPGIEPGTASMLKRNYTTKPCALTSVDTCVLSVLEFLRRERGISLCFCSQSLILDSRGYSVCSVNNLPRH